MSLFLAVACTPVQRERPLEEVIAAAQGGDGGAVRELVALFSHPDREVSQKAWETVVDIGAPAEGEVIAALGSEDVTVAEYAAGALGNIGSGAAVEPLAAALEGWERRQYVAAWALGEIGDPRAIPALVRAMGSEDAEVGKYATRSLIKYGRDATEALLQALGDDSPAVRHYAVRALGEIRDPRSIGPILALEDKVDREVHLWALGRLGDPRGYDLIAASVAAPERDVRLTAIQAIRDLGDERAVPLLEDSLDDEEWMIREWAARGLESITGDRYRYRNQHGKEVYPYALYR
jgi:HEAT repeat protein